MRSSTWNIAFGDYELSIDRRSLTLTLTDAKTATIWGTNVPLGWMEVQERATETITRHDFGTMRQLTVSEKAGPQGKRILWGLDLDGIPVDLYLISAQREIQMVVEANRDSRTHRIVGFGLVPGLCQVPDDSSSYLVVPRGNGALYPATQVPDDELLPIWDVLRGVTMPFAGAVRNAPLSGAHSTDSSALALVTDSAYGAIRLSQKDGFGAASIEYGRDPERRRLDLRILLLPQGDHISIARTYREKLINDTNHVTLRRKMRDRSPLLQFLQEGVSASVSLSDQHSGPAMLRSIEHQSAWDYQEHYLQSVEESRLRYPDVLLGDGGACDWANVALDWIQFPLMDQLPVLAAPLYPVVYHDAVITLKRVDTGVTPLDLLLHLGFGISEPFTLGIPQLPVLQEPQRSLFYTLPRLTFAAFLTAHRFLTPDHLAEEAVYSDKTRVVINRSETGTYESDDLTLPPLGFYVHHPQMEAHDALRVGRTIYTERRWRIIQAMDGKALEQSSDVRQQEFPVPSFTNETDRCENPLQ